MDKNNIKVNDRIRFVKDAVGFNKGDITIVVDVYDTYFKFSNVLTRNGVNVGIGGGVMSFDEFDKYFEKVEEPKKNVKKHSEKTRNWTDWKLIESNGRLEFFYRTDDVTKVQVKIIGNPNIRSEATCDNADEFSLEKGISIAYKRAMKKYYQNENKKYKNEIAEITNHITNNCDKIRNIEHDIKMIINND